MISPTMALTAAHCVQEEENRSDPDLSVVLADGERYGIKEFRVNDCWDFGYFGGPYSADIAIMVLDRAIPNAVRGQHYVDIWNAATMGDVVGKEFILAGWGASGEIREDGSEDHLVYEIFHRGYNTVDEIRNGMLVYDFDRPDQAHALEAMGHFGDSGSGAYIDVDGTLKIAGVKSNGQDAFYGSMHEYTRVGDLNQPWIEANLASPGSRVAVEECSAFPGYGGSGDYDDEDYYDDEAYGSDICVEECNCDYDDEDCWDGCLQCWDDYYEEGDIDEGDDSEDADDEGELSGVDCDCECEYEDIACWEACHECLDDIFSGDDDQVDDDDDQAEDGEDDYGEIDGDQCLDECNCDFDDDACWDDCNECWDEIIGDDYGEDDYTPQCEDECNCDWDDDSCWDECNECWDEAIDQYGEEDGDWYGEEDGDWYGEEGDWYGEEGDWYGEEGDWYGDEGGNFDDCDDNCRWNDDECWEEYDRCLGIF